MNTIEEQNLIRLLRATKDNNTSYNGKQYDLGYHSLKIGENYIKGQRNCYQRLEKVPYEFTDKRILDIGCNQGGMLFALQNKIKYGIGIDCDTKMVNVCNKYKNIYRMDNLEFYHFDLEKGKLNDILLLLRTSGCDIVFLLSVCMWVLNWKEIIDFSYDIAPYLLFETNGSLKQQTEQEEYLKSRYSRIDLINSESDDDPNQKNRKLYICNR